VNELYRPSDRRLLAKLVPTFADLSSLITAACLPEMVQDVDLNLLKLSNKSNVNNNI
jgi:hypothetical protein